VAEGSHEASETVLSQGSVAILIGSTRPAKVEGVRDAVAAIARIDPRFESATLRSYDLTAVAPRMPMTVDEILEGARRRAQALLTMDEWNQRTSFAVGVEGGVHPLAVGEVQWTLQTWAAVTDGRHWGYGAGPSLALPVAVAERVNAGEELGEVIDRLAGGEVRGTRGAWGLLTHDLIGRRDAFRLATMAAFARFYNEASWL
jgi:inosine/xanthosine triphosphatase